MAALIPWEEFETRYKKNFAKSGTGYPALSVRMALAALIIKEELRASDRACVEQITENPYLQYFCGLKAFLQWCSKMKIAWTHTFPPEKLSSGVFMYELANEVHKQGIDLDLLYIGKLKTPFDFIRNYRSLKGKVANYDIVHAQYGSGCGFLTSKLPGKIKFLTIRGSDWYGAECGSLKLRSHSFLAKKLTRHSLKHYHQINVMSERTLLDVRDYSECSSNKLVCLPDGIDLSIFFPMSKLKAREQLGFSGDHSRWVLFSTVSINNPIKRFKLAQKAVDYTKKYFPNLKLQIMTQIDRKNVPLFINASDVILLTSTHEGWPNIIKEGLACNIPFVSTDVSDLHLIAKKENNCYVVEDDPLALADALKKVLSNEEENNLRYHVEKMDIKNVAHFLIDQYKKHVSSI
ncbi:MAG: glycosyltransferase [Desulfobulbaceae bacterium]|nr:glycosyltransferase [Desulfobulbaceae bacterium]